MLVIAELAQSSNPLPPPPLISSRRILQLGGNEDISRALHTNWALSFFAIVYDYTMIEHVTTAFSYYTFFSYKDFSAPLFTPLLIRAIVYSGPKISWGQTRILIRGLAQIAHIEQSENILWTAPFKLAERGKNKL